MYPHYCDGVGTIDESFWRNTSHAWKMSQRLLALVVIMPTSLRGCVRPVHRALMSLVLGLRLLDGHVYSRRMCRESLGVQPGAHCLHKVLIKTAEDHILTGLSMLEDCLPVTLTTLTLIRTPTLTLIRTSPITLIHTHYQVCHLTPSVHQLVHYAQQVRQFGCLRMYWMFPFERFNKVRVIRLGK